MKTATGHGRTGLRNAAAIAAAAVVAVLALASCSSGGDSNTAQTRVADDTDASASTEAVTTIEEVPEDELLFDPVAEQEAREAAAAEADSAQEEAIAAVASDEAAEIDGVFVVPVPDEVVHVDGAVGYPTSPGVGGDHAAGWQNCGFYTVPVVEEQAVHSLEHGAVWITYNDSTTDIDKLILETVAVKEDYTLVSPYPNQESPLVLSAWGRQLSLDTLDDPLFEQFLDMYRGDGPTTPEVGAACSGAFGIPPTDVTTIAE